MSDILRIGIYQFDVVWENVIANQKKIEDLLSTIENIPDILILPEMYSTGFSMNPDRLDNTLLLDHIKWQKAVSDKYHCSIMGSVLYPFKKSYLNRFLYTKFKKDSVFYDKRHLFFIERDSGYYSSGNERKVFEYGAFKIMPQICYDLRFPVWSRNNLNYDVLVYVANWPSSRKKAWSTLLPARAIENQCYVVGVNRVGSDKNDYNYSGESAIYSPEGEEIGKLGSEEGYAEVEISMHELIEFRKKFPFYKDADEFKIINPGT